MKNNNLFLKGTRVLFVVAIFVILGGIFTEKAFALYISPTANVNLRSAPTSNSKIIGVAKDTEVFKVLDITKNGWYVFLNKQGKTCFIKKSSAKRISQDQVKKQIIARVTVKLKDSEYSRVKNALDCMYWMTDKNNGIMLIPGKPYVLSYNVPKNLILRPMFYSGKKIAGPRGINEIATGIKTAVKNVPGVKVRKGKRSDYAQITKKFWEVVDFEVVNTNSYPVYIWGYVSPDNQKVTLIVRR